MKIKKLFGIAISCLLLACFIQGKPTEAATGDFAGEKKSDFAYAINDLYKESLYGGLTLYKQQIKTLQNGDESKKTWNSHTVQWVDIPASSEAVNVVPWTMTTADQWDNETVRRIAADYEKTHPGWMVVAGINGDFFDVGDPVRTGEPTNIHVQEGETYQPYAINDPNYRAGLGFLNNDFRQMIYGAVELDNNLSIEIIENGEVVETKVATKVNELSETGISVLTYIPNSLASLAKTFDLTGYKVLVGEYDITRQSVERANKIFVKGTITSTESLGSVKVPRGNFYLVSKDGSLDNFVQIGDYVRCQHKLTGKWENAYNVIGYVHQVVDNGQALRKKATDSFSYTTHPRTLIGFKKDKSVVMMVINGRGKEADCEVGASLFQSGELRRLAGCDTAFNLDGGGSSTLIVRNERGGFETINKPSDGSERSDGNAMLVVMRNPEINFSGTNITRTGVTFTRQINELTKDFKNITVEINNKVYDFTSEKIEIEGLEENTDYEVVFSYEVPAVNDETKYVKQKYKVNIKTKNLIYPSSGLYVSEVDKNSITISKDKTGYEDWIQDVTVYVSGQAYYMGNESTFVIEELLDATKYTISYEYNVVEPGNPKRYPVTEPGTEITTLAYTLPKFVKFGVKSQTENSVIVEYEYDDEDGIAENVYIVAYNQEGKEVSRQEVSRRRGNVEFTGLDLTLQGYSFKIEVKYYESEETTILSTYRSEPITVEQIVKKPETKKTCKKSTGEYLVATLSLASLAVLVLRRKK